MGMFDYLQCNARLPVKRDSFVRCHSNPFQSKSIGLWLSEKFSDRAYNHGCVTVTISEDRTLVDPDGEPLDWSGSLVFYSGKHDFIAECVHGTVIDVREA